MRTLLTSALIAIIFLMLLSVWERFRRRRERLPAGRENEVADRAFAFSFQSDLTFAEARKVLGADGSGTGDAAAPYGEWFERDSAWYDNLLTCRSHLGARFNLYFFDDENILEIKVVEDSEAVRKFALDELLPALKARDIRRSGTVD